MNSDTFAALKYAGSRAREGRVPGLPAVANPGCWISAAQSRRLYDSEKVLFWESVSQAHRSGNEVLKTRRGHLLST